MTKMIRSADAVSSFTPSPDQCVFPFAAEPNVTALSPSEPAPKRYGEAAMGSWDEFGPDLTTWPGSTLAPTAEPPATPPPTTFRERRAQLKHQIRVLKALLNRPKRNRTAIYKPSNR